MDLFSIKSSVTGKWVVDSAAADTTDTSIGDEATLWATSTIDAAVVNVNTLRGTSEYAKSSNPHTPPPPPPGL